MFLLHDNGPEKIVSVYVIHLPNNLTVNYALEEVISGIFFQLQSYGDQLISAFYFSACL
jgi:hypothetical protein